MKFLFITLFPEQIEQAAGHSIIQRAVNKGLVEISCINPREFTHDVHRTVDDTPFGGGAGMVLKPEPMVAAIRKAKDLPELEEGQFYVADLIGLPVFDEEGKQIGTFKDSLSTGSNDVYVIAVPGEKDILLPALKIYVKEINLAEKRIVVTLPEWVDEA